MSTTSESTPGAPPTVEAPVTDPGARDAAAPPKGGWGSLPVGLI